MKKIKLILSYLVFLGVVACSSTGNEIKLKKTKFIFELGEDIKIAPSDIIDKEDLKIVSFANVDISDIELMKDKSYPAAGSYSVLLTYEKEGNKESKKIKVIVKDTTAPVFEQLVNTIEIEQGSKTIDYNNYFKITDLSEVEIKVDEQALKLDKIGEYKVKITAIDKYKNTLSKEVVVKVVDKGTTNSNNPTAGPYYFRGILVTNKKYGLPKSYDPQENKEAGIAIRKLIVDMQLQGYDISSSYSGYRSYDYQSQLYWNYVNAYGQTSADTFSARPGYSEHQTGLAFDLLHQNGSLVEKSNEVNWIKTNAHHYGFIVRYQTGKEWITGYQAEPWHLRYVGTNAPSIYRSGLSLEEYLSVEGGGYR